jgi:hypothetical protein
MRSFLLNFTILAIILSPVQNKGETVVYLDFSPIILTNNSIFDKTIIEP